MLNERLFAIFMSDHKTYPVKLARMIGVRRAILWNEYFNKFGGVKFPYTESLAINAGMAVNGRDIFDGLVSLGYFTKLNDAQYEINYNKILEITGASMLKMEDLPYNDKEFLFQLERWRTVLISKGRKLSNKDISAKLEGRPLDECIRALKVSADNKYLTLFFNDRSTEGDSKNKGGDSGEGKSGGETNQGRRGEFNTKEI